MDACTTILLTGGHGFLGSWVLAALRARGVGEGAIFAPRRAGYDLRDVLACRALMAECVERWGRGPELVVHCAGLSGGLAMCRDRPEDMRRENTAMGRNLIGAVCEAGGGKREAGIRNWESGVGNWESGFGIRGGAVAGSAAADAQCPVHGALRPLPVFLFVGHMCMYPADAPQPYREEALGSGPLDAVTGAYGEGKLAVLGALREAAGARGLRGACVIPTNLFGAGDAFHDPLRAHAAGSLIQRITDAADAGAREVVNWGTGDARREFLFVEDAAEGVVRAAEWMLGGCGASRGVGVAVGGDGSGGAAIGTTRSVVAPGEAPESVPGAPPMVLNLATGVGVSIRELGEVIAGEAGYGGRILWDSTKPDGVAMRVLDPGLARKHLGWAARTPLREAIRRTIAWYRESRDRGARTGTAGGA